MATDSGGGVITQRDKTSDLCDLNMDSAPVLQHDQNIIDNGPLNETFGEYSPQNSDFVRVFTEVGTPSQQKVNNVTNNGHEDHEFSYIQPAQESVYVPQQEFIAKLDYDLADLPKQTYISKLIEKTNNTDDCLTWYRSTLASREKSIQGCPTGKLDNRKSTTKSTSTSKYAKDCYIIYMFLQGDKTQIDEVFRKDDNKLSVVEHNSEVVSNEIIEMRANNHILLERVSELEKSDQTNEKVFTILQTENNKLYQLTETSKVPNKDQLNFKIPVRVQVNTEEIKPLNKDIFVGVTQRKRSARYYLSGIDNKSTRSGILQFLDVKGVNSTFLQLYHGKYNYSRISAKLNVTEESASIIETEAFWPAGVRCRRWLNNHDWQNRCNETP
ncbi:unnamed protein product [Mytilus coruscus]|uniref:Uncharacterized protein n=1 Tax=Mytilus coruscus TaxID=42192 RepID=A0A6J8CTU8_MYTCO|nr:unnamed protein product [Mytilus coruscus]